MDISQVFSFTVHFGALLPCYRPVVQSLSVLSYLLIAPVVQMLVGAQS